MARIDVVVRTLAIIGMLMIPGQSDAGQAVFTWVPTDGSVSGGTMIFDVPANGPFSVSGKALISLDFTFQAGVTVHLAGHEVSEDASVMSFDGGGLDRGYAAVQRPGFWFEPDASFVFSPQQLAFDVAHYRPRTDPHLTVRGTWVRVDVIPPPPAPYPRGVLGAIDLAFVADRMRANGDFGNNHGIAYDTRRGVLYMSSGDFLNFIYTLDMSGKVRGEMDFQAVYRPGYHADALSYDAATDRLLVFAVGGPAGTTTLVEMSVDGSSIFRETPLPSNVVGAMVRDDGIWQWVFGERILRHYTRDGQFVEDISLDESVPPEAEVPFSGGAVGSFLPGDASDSLLLLDFSGSRIIRADRNGRQLEAVTTRMLGDSVGGDGRPSALAMDPSGLRLFLLGDDYVFILSPDFLKVRKVQDLVRLQEFKAAFNRTPVPQGRAGTALITARFENISVADICSVFFQVVDLSVDGRKTNSLESVSNTSTGQQWQGFNELLFGHQPAVIKAGESVSLRFKIDLDLWQWFNFVVEMWGTPLAPGTVCP